MGVLTPGPIAKSLLIGVAVISLAACSSREKRNEKFAYVEEPVEQLYAQATDNLERKRFEEAIAFFGEVERQHPYSAWARRASLMTAFAQYQSNDYEDTIETVDRFLAVHPGNKDAPYAYYLKAMSYYERIRDTGRDQGLTQQAQASLTDVIKRYPDSEYARDAKLKLDLTYDHLAGKEMEVGRWYLRQNQHIAALNRFDSVLKQYQTTSHTPEALHRIVEAYLQMGVVPEARRHAAVLGYNYPGSVWYQDTYKLFSKRGILIDDPVRAPKPEVEEKKVLSTKDLVEDLPQELPESINDGQVITDSSEEL